MIKTLSKKRILKFIAVFLAVNLLLEILVPTMSYALTNGPSQPEIQSFEPIGTSEMVNLFNGDFTYNIPLFELPGPNGGYPFNLAYNSGIGMDQEASWVGLGWNLQPGSMTRSMAGMPDEFNGDRVFRRMDMLEDRTVGIKGGATFELFGADAIVQGGVSASLGIYNNSYRGMSTELGLGLNLSKSFMKTLASGKQSVGVSLGLNAQLTLNSQDGVDVGMGASVGLKARSENSDGEELGLNLTTDIGFNYNHMRGLSNMSLGLNASASARVKIDDQVVQKVKQSKDVTLKDKNAKLFAKASLSAGMTATLATANPGYNPQVSMPFVSKSFVADAKVGPAFSGAFWSASFGISYSSQKLKDANTWVSTPAYGYLNLEGANGDPNSILDSNREKDGIVRDESSNLWMPRLTFDSYSVTGHGMFGAFRPYRRDFGAVWDQAIRSESNGHTVGAELGYGTLRFGANYGHNTGYSASSRMDFIEQNYKFQSNGNNNHPITYFKAHGEPTSKATDVWNEIGGYNPVYFEKNTSNKKDYRINNVLKGEGFSVAIDPNQDGKLTMTDNTLFDEPEDKEIRNSIVLPIKNEDLLTNNGNEVLKEFQLEYYDHTANGADVNDFSNPEPFSREEEEVANIGELGSSQESADAFKINKKHHNAGFYNIDPSGLRYIYGLPVYNTEQVDAQFSVPKTANADIIDIRKNGDDIDYHINNSDHYLSKTKIPPYAYSYMLTSILGVDYIDADDIPGPSKGDLGYWVKFNYRKVASDYQWRAPFAGAKYNPGIHNTAQDDRGSYSYGKKEIWYLATAETATHKAEFHVQQRDDARGALSELQNNNEKGKHSYYLEKIVLYSKLEKDVPIKTIKMEYNKNGTADFTLCQNVLNNQQSGGKSGKLTLSKVWFEYQNNSIGSRTPYVFNYGIIGDANIPYNPAYKPYNVDRWGNFRDLEELIGTGSDADYWQYQLDFPYVTQEGGQANRDLLDKYAHAWQLTDITLPSGGKIKVQYEADDYGYVQNKTAMYMTDIVGVSSNATMYGYEGGTGKPTTFPATTDAMMKLFTKGSLSMPRKEHTRVYFRLKEKVKQEADQTIDRANQYNELLKYIDQTTWQLYFKTKIYLQDERKEELKEFVAGYADIVRLLNSAPVVQGGPWLTNIGHTANSAAGLVGDDGSGNYTHGFITVHEMAKGDWHPFSVAAWQHIQVNQPALYTSRPNLPTSNSSDANIIQSAMGLLNMGEFIGQMTKGFYKWAGIRKEWGRKLVQDKAWIRLNVPDKVKIGGGSRVKQVTLSDEWEYKRTDDTQLLGVNKALYGQVYEYTTEDENGNTISSGVAAYEPLMGGDEISVRTARKFSSGVPLRNDNDFFFEFPINESFYPGPSVGYSKVKVKSLASTNAQNVNDSGAPDGFHSTSGMTAHEFYTAKDFPVITSESYKDDKFGKPKTKFRIVLKESIQNAVATQGYTVIQNNMHGQNKKISNYAMDDEGNVKSKPLSWVEYKFKSETAEAHGLPALKLVNKVITLTEDKDGKGDGNGDGTVGENELNKPKLEERIIGEEMDFFIDARETISFSKTDGGSFNFDMAGLPPIFNFPIITILPSLHRSKIISRTVSTNKVISRVGILEQVTAFEQGAEVSTKNEVWDAQTGEVVLTSIDNNFNDKVYSYNIPAHLKYEGLGAAYKNIGMTVQNLEFERLISKYDNYAGDDNPNPTHEYKPNYYTISPTDFGSGAADLYPGDEFIVSNTGTAVAKAVYVGIEKGYLTFFCETDLAALLGKDTSIFLYRSGRRNLLTAKVGSIVALKNPLLDEANGGARKAQSATGTLPTITVPDCPNDNCLDRGE